NKSGETGAFQYFDGWHDRFQKIVLGKPIPEHQPPMADGLAVLERVATHPGTARHVALRLCRRLLCDEPRPQLIEQVAKVFLAKAGDKNQLRAVVLAIVNSDDFVTTPPAKFRR